MFWFDSGVVVWSVNCGFGLFHGGLCDLFVSMRLLGLVGLLLHGLLDGYGLVVVVKFQFRLVVVCFGAVVFGIGLFKRYLLIVLFSFIKYGMRFV